MRLSIYDPSPPCNEYATRMFLGPLRSYCADHGIETVLLDDPETVHDAIVVIVGDRLSHERIARIKENGNKLIVFDINDSSYISTTYGASSLVPEIDLIFKISGVPNKNTTLEPSIGANFNIASSEVKYLPDDEWEKFQALRPKIKPLPYVLWTPLAPAHYSPAPASERTGKVLVGGGSHFWRVILFFKLVQKGLNDPASQFATDAYFVDSMTPQFRYCDTCRAEKKAIGRTPYNAVRDPSQCASPGAWGKPEDIVGGPGTGKSPFGHFNNSCPAAFFWWAKQYEHHSGPLNDSIERALNGRFRPAEDFLSSLCRASYYADYKPLNTIYAPPRFWEAASVGTVNLYPKRTADQDHWPHMEADVHYLTFPEDMSSFEFPDDIRWGEVSRAAYDLYENKIRGTRYPIATALLKHIFSNIEEAVS